MQPDPNEAGVFSEIDNTPKLVGGLVLASVAVLIMLKSAGFRFTFSAKVGAK